jgi:hypothetical protein
LCFFFPSFLSRSAAFIMVDYGAVVLAVPM